VYSELARAGIARLSKFRKRWRRFDPPALRYRQSRQAARIPPGCRSGSGGDFGLIDGQRRTFQRAVQKSPENAAEFHAMDENASQETAVRSKRQAVLGQVLLRPSDRRCRSTAMTADSLCGGRLLSSASTRSIPSAIWALVRMWPAASADHIQKLTVRPVRRWRMNRFDRPATQPKLRPIAL
jgi:hypothetical protein